MKEIESIKKLMESDRPAEWNMLPDIDLYMDQVVSYIGRQTAGGKSPAMTSAMINNYVKDGLLPRANGKRYTREHLVYLVAIGMLKNVLTVKDIKLILGSEIQSGSEPDFYTDFLSSMDEAFSAVGDSIDGELSEAELAHAAMVLALASCASKTACEHMLTVLQSKQERAATAKKAAAHTKPEKK